MNEELKQKAEDFIIDRYKIAERYREDNVETREYMRMDVHYQYEREYQLYLDATKELQEKNCDLEDKLANADYQLEGRDNEIRELTEKIEKMKCCSMCKYYSMSFLPYWCTKNNTAPHCTSKCDKWEIKEK